MKKSLLFISLTLNVIGIAFVAFLFSPWGIRQGVTDYMILPAHDRRVSQFEELSIPKNATVFLGDSITEGGLWSELLPGHTVINRGIGGDTTEQVLERLDQISEYQPKQLFLMIGTNDLTLGIDIDRIIENIREIVGQINVSSPDTQVFVQSLLPREANLQSDVESLNNALREAIKTKATWIDLYPLFLDTKNGSIRDDLSNDEIHLLGAGYLVWRDSIVSYLR